MFTGSKQNIKKLLTYTHKENIGIYQLLILIVVLLLINIFWSDIFKQEKIIDAEFQDSIKAFFARTTPIEKLEYENRMERFIEERYDSIALFIFDPNTASASNFQKLGLSKKQIKTITNFRNKGGFFDTPTDFQKIYGIRQKQFEMLEPYIQIKQSFTSSKRSPLYKKKQTPIYKDENFFAFDPNKIDTANLSEFGLSKKIVARIQKYREKGGEFKIKSDFRNIYGMPNDFFEIAKPFIHLPDTIIKRTVKLNTENKKDLIASNLFTENQVAKIIEHRKELGGFALLSQLTDYYIIKPTDTLELKPYIIIDRSDIKTININLATREVLRAHPYISYQLAQDIAVLRSYSGTIKTTDALLKNRMVAPELFNKLKYYISVD